MNEGWRCPLALPATEAGSDSRAFSWSQETRRSTGGAREVVNNTGRAGWSTGARMDPEAQTYTQTFTHEPNRGTAPAPGHRTQVLLRSREQTSAPTGLQMEADHRGGTGSSGLPRRRGDTEGDQGVNSQRPASSNETPQAWRRTPPPPNAQVHRRRHVEPRGSVHTFVGWTSNCGQCDLCAMLRNRQNRVSRMDLDTTDLATTPPLRVNEDKRPPSNN